MGKVKKVLAVAQNVATAPIEKTRDSNNLLLLILIVVVWLFLFFRKGKENG